MSLVPTCPTDCSTLLPDVAFDACNPKIYFGEIHKVYLAAVGAADFTDVEDLAEWTARLAETAGDIDSIREFTVMADSPAPDQTVVELSNKRKARTPSTFTLNIDVDELSDENYEFMRTTHCNQQYKLWYATDDHMYGGNTGMDVDFFLNYLIERGSKSQQKMSGTATWESKFPPQRTDNPFAS